MLIPVSAIIPTKNRAAVLKRTLDTLAMQNFQPQEVIVVDVSDDDKTKLICHTGVNGLSSALRWYKGSRAGAASQRNQGVEHSKYSYVLFMDDDILFEDKCIERIWNCIQQNEHIGGVNAMITNQRYVTPGRVTRFMYRLMSGQRLKSYAGKCIGPAWNLLPEDRDDLPHYIEVDWMNLGCTLYRKSALPYPVFTDNFTGYSLMEDLALSLTVGKKWKLLNARTARIYHDSQPGSHKNNLREISEMSVMNRHFIMSHILKKNHFVDHLKLLLFEIFGLISLIKAPRKKNFIPVLIGKINAFRKLIMLK